MYLWHCRHHVLFHDVYFILFIFVWTYFDGVFVCRVHIDTRGEQVELVLQVALPSDVGIYKCRVDLLSETESEKKHIEEVTTTLFIMGE